MLQVAMKLKMLKKELKSLNKSPFSNIPVEAEEDRTTLNQAQLNLQTNPTDIILQQVER